MAVQEIVEQQAKFEEGIENWQVMEDETIASCQNIIAATDNKLVQTIAGIIMADSEKHKQVLDCITDTLDGTVTLTPDELGEVSELLDQHLQIEKDSINLANEEYDKSRNFIVRHLLSYLIEDERKHAKLVRQLNDFKKRLYPYG